MWGLCTMFSAWFLPRSAIACTALWIAFLVSLFPVAVSCKRSLWAATPTGGEQHYTLKSVHCTGSDERTERQRGRPGSICYAPPAATPLCAWVSSLVADSSCSFSCGQAAHNGCRCPWEPALAHTLHTVKKETVSDMRPATTCNQGNPPPSLAHPCRR